MQPSVFIALPVYIGLQARTFQAIMGCFSQARIHVHLLGGCPEIAKARSELVAVFLESECEHLLFVDSDIGFGPEVLRDLLDCNAALVTATYKEKASPHNWTCEGAGTLVSLPLSYQGRRRLRTIPILRAGLGLTLIRRDVFTSIQAFNRNLFYQSEASQKQVCHMFAPMIERDSARIPRLLSEDTAFYFRARQVGIQPHCLIDATIDHSGVIANLGKELDTHRGTPYSGSCSNLIMSQPPDLRLCRTREVLR